MTTTALAPLRAAHKASLEFVADQFELETATVDQFLDAGPEMTVNLDVGYKDGGGAPVTVRLIEGGRVEEWELAFTEREIRAYLRGRDQAARLLDTYMSEQYGPNDESATGLDCGAPAPTGALPPPENLGPAAASAIAQKACEKAGLTLQWEVRDYTVSQPFSAAGRIIDVITKLVEPWTMVAPYKVDLFLRGTTLVVRHRYPPPVDLALPASTTFPVLPAVAFIDPPADYFITVPQARQSRLSLKRRLLTRIGRVTFHGTQTTDDPNQPPPGPSEATETDDSETFGPQGEALTSTVSEYVYAMPDRVLLRSTKRTYRTAFGKRLLIHEEKLVNYYTEGVYDVTGTPTVLRKLSSQHVSRREYVYTLFFDSLGGQSVFTEQVEEDSGYAYDGCGFLKKQTTLAVNLTDQFKSTLTVKTIRTVRPLVVEQVTERSTWNGSGWVVRQRDSQTSAGFPPDGPGRLGGASGSNTVTTPIVVQSATISTDPTAQALDYTNENLGLADLNHILTMAAAADNLFEWEARFSGVTMPWIRVGHRLKLSGLVDHQGTEVPLPTLVVTEMETVADESSARASLTTPTLRAFGYSRVDPVF